MANVPDISADECLDPPANSDAPRYIIRQVADHTMLASLFEYVRQKVHQDIASKDWSEIVVRGQYTRCSPARAADSEKRDKMFNWHRPTTTQLGSGTIAVNCFPGIDYTEHYASLIATYLALTGKDFSVVRCERPPASRCSELFLASNLTAMGPANVVVIGYADRLRGVHTEDWQGRENGEGLFSWKKRKLPNGKTVAYLVSMASFWGDIAGSLVRVLQQLTHMECLLYLGKAGALRPEADPNQWLVTGEGSYVGAELVTWHNVLDAESSMSKKTLTGNMVTVPSPLCESFEWLEEWRSKGSWVDCEVGHMAGACKEGGIEFGYLHIVSDNVSKGCEESLANEQVASVRAKRQILFDEVETALEAFLARFGSESALNGCI